MNGTSTETYEALHKSNVKKPYRMTNKKNYIPQMLNTVCYVQYQENFTRNFLAEPQFDTAYFLKFKRPILIHIDINPYILLGTMSIFSS